MFTIYHNPRCTKSRETLALLQQHDQKPVVVLYLETPPSHSQLQDLLRQLGIGAHDLLRRQEDEYKALGLDQPGLNESAIIDAMVTHPRLIERPIVTDGKRAVIGRPPENVLELLP